LILGVPFFKRFRKPRAWWGSPRHQQKTALFQLMGPFPQAWQMRAEICLPYAVVSSSPPVMGRTKSWRTQEKLKSGTLLTGSVRQKSSRIRATKLLTQVKRRAWNLIGVAD
jgi:hypothetical protein